MPLLIHVPIVIFARVASRLARDDVVHRVVVHRRTRVGVERASEDVRGVVPARATNHSRAIDDDAHSSASIRTRGLVARVRLATREAVSRDAIDDDG